MAANSAFPAVEFVAQKESTAGGFIYKYTVINKSKYPISAFSIGLDHLHGSLRELTVPPIGFKSGHLDDEPDYLPAESTLQPENWKPSADLVSEGQKLAIRWEIQEGQLSAAIQPGQTVQGFGVKVPREDDKYLKGHVTVYLTEGPMITHTVLTDEPIRKKNDEDLRHKVEAAAKSVGCKLPMYSSAIEAQLFSPKHQTVIFGCYHSYDPSLKMEPHVNRIFVIDPANPCGAEVPSFSSEKISIVRAEDELGEETRYASFNYLKASDSGKYTRYSGKDKNQKVSEKLIQACRSPACTLYTLYVCHKGQWLSMGRD